MKERGLHVLLVTWPISGLHSKLFVLRSSKSGRESGQTTEYEVDSSIRVFREPGSAGREIVLMQPYSRAQIRFANSGLALCMS